MRSGQHEGNADDADDGADQRVAGGPLLQKDVTQRHGEQRRRRADDGRHAGAGQLDGQGVQRAPHSPAQQPRQTEQAQGAPVHLADIAQATTGLQQAEKAPPQREHAHYSQRTY